MPSHHLPTVLDVLLQTAVPAPGRMTTKVSPVEDIMLEHGFAERIMLVWERIVKDWKSRREIDPPLVNRTARMAKACISGCHEQNEERWLFPLFREEGYLEDVVVALEAQHEAGREVVDKIIELSTPGRIRNETQMNMLMTLCRSYIFMYRPHISRENSELFPRLSGIASPTVIDDIAGKMASSTRDSLGREGFAGPMRELAEIERSLEIHDLREYTIG